MNEDECLRRYGLNPTGDDLDQIRAILRREIEREYDEEGDRQLMRLCCVQLFNAGRLEDVLLIWDAKESSFDAHCTIDVQLLCGAGLEETKVFLAGEDSQDAADALEWVVGCEKTRDFDRFTVERYSRSCADNYYSG